jgi:4-amino-4-deoxy-L-arabinose transferase-like glycosyltransferase
VDVRVSDATAVAPGRALPAEERARDFRVAKGWRRLLAVSEVLPVALVMAVALAMPLVVMPPPAYADPAYVFQAAQLWPNIPPDMPYIHQSMRIGLVLPARLFQELLGDGQLSFIVASMLLGALLAIGTYLLGRVLFGRLVGVAAVGILLVHPFFVVVDPYVEVTAWSTGQLMPDMPAAGWFALGVVALLLGARAGDRRQIAWLVAAGTCFGLAYLVREFIALMYVGIPVFLVLLRIPLLRIVAVAAPMIAILAVELVHSAFVFGHPLARILTAAAHGTGGAPLPTTPTALEVIGRFYTAMTMWHPLGILFLVALGLSVVGWVVTRDRRLALTVVWFLALWLPLTLLAGIVNPDSPSLRAWIVRYWIPVFPPLIVGALGAMALLGRRMPSEPVRRAFTGIAIAAVALVYLVPAATELGGLRRDTAWSELRDWISGRQDIENIWTDDRAGQTLAFYTRSPTGEPLWTGTVSTFGSRVQEIPDSAAGGPLLVSRYSARERPSEKAGWRLLWQSSDGLLRIWDR